MNTCADEKPLRIAITTNATDNYLYAMGSFLQALAQNLCRAEQTRKNVEFLIILVGNESMEEWRDYAQELGLDDSHEFRGTRNLEVIKDSRWKETKKYSDSQNLMVAQMRMAALNHARRWGADLFWMLDADVIPPPNALSCSIDMIEFDNGWYDIAFCPYPSQGGGSYLGGHGTPREPIFPDFRPEEREVGTRLLNSYEKAKAAFEKKPSQSTWDKVFNLRKKIERTCPPKHGGNIMKHSAEYGWRRRGFLDYAYPGIGLGSVVPTDWWGFGCTLLSHDALMFADFVGYTGKGTEDLFMGYQKFHARGMRSVVVTHCPVGHVIRVEREGEVEKEIIHCHATHELIDEETRGHLRRDYIPHYQHIPGEEFRETPKKQVIHIDEEQANREQAHAFQGGDEEDSPVDEAE